MKYIKYVYKTKLKSKHVEIKCQLDATDDIYCILTTMHGQNHFKFKKQTFYVTEHDSNKAHIHFNPNQILGTYIINNNGLDYLSCAPSCPYFNMHFHGT